MVQFNLMVQFNIFKKLNSELVADSQEKLSKVPSKYPAKQPKTTTSRLHEVLSYQSV